MRSIAAPMIFLAMSAVLAPAFGQTSRGAADNSPALTGRLERLEEQVTNLQGVVAAVETLAKNSGGGGGYSAAAGGGASSEQVRQLSEQIAELTRRLQRLELRLGSNTAPGSEDQREQTGFNTTTPADGFEDKEQLPPLSAPQAEPDRYASRPAYGAPTQQAASAAQSAAQPRSYGAIPPHRLLPRRGQFQPPLRRRLLQPRLFSIRLTPHIAVVNIPRPRLIFSSSSISIQKMRWQEARTIGLGNWPFQVASTARRQTGS